MVNAKNKRNKMLDLLLLLAVGLLVAAAGTAAFWQANKHQINPAWLFATGAAVLFFVAVGWGYRRKFRSPMFVVFFLFWLLAHVLIYLLVLGYLGFLYYVPLSILELWIGYIVAIWLFGPPANRGIR